MKVLVNKYPQFFWNIEKTDLAFTYPLILILLKYGLIFLKNTGKKNFIYCNNFYYKEIILTLLEKIIISYILFTIQYV